MPNRHVEVDTYRLYFRPQPSPSWSFPGGFTANQCYGYLFLTSKTSSDYFFLAIVDNSVATLPESKTSTGTSAWGGSAALKQENLSGMLDLLRNEKPIYMTIWDSIPHANTISTSAEPIGEGADTSP